MCWKLVEEWCEVSLFFSIHWIVLFLNYVDFIHREINGRKVRVEMSNPQKMRGRDRERARGSVRSRGRPFNPDDKCYECGGRGHYARDCRNKRGSGGRRRRWVEFNFLFFFFCLSQVLSFDGHLLIKNLAQTIASLTAITWFRLERLTTNIELAWGGKDKKDDESQVWRHNIFNLQIICLISIHLWKLKLQLQWIHWLTRLRIVFFYVVLIHGC